MSGGIAWWAELYRTTDIVQLLAALGHLASIAYAARFALRGDRAALRLTSDSRRPEHDLLTITRAHRHVLTGLFLALLTGAAQLAAQLDYLPRSPIFWIKMTMLLVLLANGRIIQLAGRRAEDGVIPGSLRGAAQRSIALWCTLLLLGLLLTTVRP